MSLQGEFSEDFRALSFITPKGFISFLILVYLFFLVIFIESVEIKANWKVSSKNLNDGK